jgi:hypothetical protein
MSNPFSGVMAGLVPAIYVLLAGVLPTSISLVGRVDSEPHHETSILAENLISGRTDSGSSRVLMVKLI